MARGAAMAGSLAVWWGLLFGLYLILIGPVSALEYAVGAAAAALATLGAEAVRRAAGPRLGGTSRLAAALLAWPPTLLRECGQLAAVTWRALRGRQVRGQVRSVRLAPGTGAAWAAALLSAAPGSCVLETEPAGETGLGAVLTVHLLTGSVSGLERAVAVERLR